MRYARLSGLLFLSALAACTASAPLAPTTSSGAITAPAADTPADSAVLTTRRPTLIVKNASGGATGARLYDFEVSDKSDFGGATPSMVAHQTGIAEGSGGATSYTPDADLPGATRLYWRARAVQGGSASDWTAVRSLTTGSAPFNRAGALFDPLTGGSTIGTPSGNITFNASGVKIGDTNSYVRYQLAQPLASGEMSVEISGLAPGGPGAKLKVFSMMDGTGDLFQSNYLFNAQYRGVAGNPDNSVSFKMLMGDPALKLEPSFDQRGVVSLDPSHTYLWRAIWGNGIRLVVQDETTNLPIYDLTLTLADIGLDTSLGSYNPRPHFAYLGANNGPFGEEDGSWPGAVYKNLWIGTGPRPQSLGTKTVSESGR